MVTSLRGRPVSGLPCKSTKVTTTKKSFLLFSLILAALLAAGCGAAREAAPAAPETPSPAEPKSEVASAGQMAPVEDVVDPDMVPVCADVLQDGTYAVTVDSSSSMFNIAACGLTVAEGQMSAVMHMGGTGCLYVYPGTGEEAALLPYAEGSSTFEIPVAFFDRRLVVYADTTAMSPPTRSSTPCVSTPRPLKKRHDRENPYGPPGAPGAGAPAGSVRLRPERGAALAAGAGGDGGAPGSLLGHDGI